MKVVCVVCVLCVVLLCVVCCVLCVVCCVFAFVEHCFSIDILVGAMALSP